MAKHVISFSPLAEVDIVGTAPRAVRKGAFGKRALRREMWGGA